MKLRARTTLGLAMIMASLSLAAPAWLKAAPMAFTHSKAQATPDLTFPRPETASKWPHVSLKEAQRLHSQPGVVFVDGRNNHEWGISHIPGSVSLPAGEIDKRFPMLKAKLAKAKVIVIYCHGQYCGLADTVAQLLYEKGLNKLAVFWGGFPEWQDAGLLLEDKENRTFGGENDKALKKKNKAKMKKAE
jgi:rhodanese-related sulfurtransferase